MTNRMKAGIGMLVYLTGCSVLFGAIFTQPQNPAVLAFGFGGFFVAQAAAIYLLTLIRRTEP